ncbi:MAG TPA: YtxH domain-containing protein [Anaerolineaceae bacterium]|nr:YtxH domain-containing protein [Anaerolineaceae bacterium]
MSDSDNFGAFLVGFLVGGITGAIVSLLYAPASGDKTREVLKDKAIELKDKTSETATDVYSKAETFTKEQAAKVSKIAKETSEKAAVVLKKGQVILEGDKPKEIPAE